MGEMKGEMKMTRWMSNLKWIVGALVVVVALTSVSVAHGGGRWRGADPELKVNGNTINVWVEWPEEFTCEIADDIDIKIEIDKKAEVVFIGESSEIFDCLEDDDDSNDDDEVNVRTITELKDSKKKGIIKIKGKLHGTEVFPFRIVVYIDGEVVAVCDGKSHDKDKEKKFSADCGEIEFDVSSASGDAASIGRHSKIHKSVVLGDNVTVGDHTKIDKHVVIGDDVQIGDDVKIDDRTQIGSGTVIGDGTEIKKNVVIGENVQIGSDVEIKDKAVICDGEIIPDGTVVDKKTTVGSC